MSDEQETGNEHDEHHDEHSFPGWLHAGESPIQGFMKVFAWLVFFTILEVMAILQEFSFEVTMVILFGIVMFLAIGLTSPGAVDDLRTICGF